MSMSNESLAIEVSGLKKYYGQTKAVDGMNFEVSKGEIFGLLGPNGAGKSTTMEIIVGLRDRDEGEVKVLGFDPGKEPKQVKVRVGVQLQTVSLFPRLTVLETLKLFSSFFPEPRNLDEVINQLGLEDKRNEQITKLSGGQTQRVAVAIAMVSNGEIIFLDEPTAGLDPQSRQKLWEVIVELKKLGKTIFLTTHYMDEAQKLCNRVAIVDYGTIVAIGTPNELIDKYFEETSLELVQPALMGDERLGNLPGVTRVVDSDSNIIIHTTKSTETITALMDLTKTLGIKLDDMRIRHANLEDVFLKLTGRSIRE